VLPCSGGIVYFSELSQYSLRNTLRALESTYGIPAPTIQAHVQTYRLAPVPAADPDAMREFTEKCFGAQLVIIDTFDDWLGDNPNRTETVLAGWHILREVAQTGAAVLVFDHRGKFVLGYDEKMAAVAGSSAKLRQPDLVYQMEPRSSPDRHNVLKPIKERIPGVGLELRLTPAGQLEATPLAEDDSDQAKLNDAERFILNLLEAGDVWRRKDIEQSGQHAGHAPRTIDRALQELKRTGKVHQPERGKYAAGPRRKDNLTMAKEAEIRDANGQNVSPRDHGGHGEVGELRQHSANSVARRLGDAAAQNGDVSPKGPALYVLKSGASPSEHAGARIGNDHA
jgi:hypothetical protein